MKEKKIFISTMKERAYHVGWDKEIDRFKLSIFELLDESKWDIKAYPKEQYFFHTLGGSITRRQLAKALRSFAYRIQKHDRRPNK